jgi:hypothetical protein
MIKTFKFLGHDGGGPPGAASIRARSDFAESAAGKTEGGVGQRFFFLFFCFCLFSPVSD